MDDMASRQTWNELRPSLASAVGEEAMAALSAGMDRFDFHAALKALELLDVEALESRL
jgi:hypothetical protein